MFIADGNLKKSVKLLNYTYYIYLGTHSYLKKPVKFELDSRT